MIKFFFFDSRIVLTGDDVDNKRIRERLHDHFGDRPPQIEFPNDVPIGDVEEGLLRRLVSVLRRFIKATLRFKRRQ